MYQGNRDKSRVVVNIDSVKVVDSDHRAKPKPLTLKNQNHEAKQNLMVFDLRSFLVKCRDLEAVLNVCFVSTYLQMSCEKCTKVTVTNHALL